MADKTENITTSAGLESIDLNKLSIILRTRWIWIVLIFITINVAAYLVVRYTKNLYESSSEIKLDFETNASELGIKSVVEDQNLNFMSGEIEIIRSKLFLNRVLDRSHFEVSFISVGHLLNDEMFTNAPAHVTFYNKSHSFYNVPIHYKELDTHHFELHVGDNGQAVQGKYGEKVLMGDLELVLQHNDNFKKGDEIGYFFVIHSREAMLNYLLSNLAVEPLNFNANTIRVSFKDHNAFKAQAILNKIDTIYLQYSNEQKNLANKQKIDWLNNELSHIERQMEDYENYFENFTLQNRTNDLDEDLKNTITAINKIDSQRFEFSRRVKEVHRLLDGINAGNFAPTISLRQFLPELVNKNMDVFQQLQLELERLKLSHHEITFTYRQKQNEIDALRIKIKEQLTELQDEWTRRLQSLNEQKTSLERNFANLPDKNTQFSKNQRFYKLYEEFYLTLMQSKSEFEIAQAGSTPDFKILSPASLPIAPISPNRKMIAGIGFVMSFILNFFFIGILYLANNKITSLVELERIGSVPVLGAIPQSKYSNGTGLYIADYPKSMVSEALRSLRTNLEFFNYSSNKKVIAISSTVSGEGKSFVALNLGGIFALSKKKVVLVDLDMRKPKTQLPVALPDTTKGMSTILIRKHTWQDCIVPTALENFDYIPSGPHPPNPSELLIDGEFTELLARLKEKYDFIILDTPPVGLVTDGIMAMKHADVSIYIFRANYSKKEFLFNLKRVISMNKFSNITTILNAVSSRKKTYGYGYYDENGTKKS